MTNEEELKKWILTNGHKLSEFIVDYKSSIEDAEEFKIKDTHHLKEYLEYFYLKNLSKTLLALESIEIIGEEVPISVSGFRGKRPSIDVLGASMYSDFVIFELKIRAKTEREAMTEILSYAQGLTNIIPQVERGKIIFIIISSEWRRALKNAVLYLIAYEDIRIVPLKYDATQLKDKKSRLKLGLVKPDIPDLKIKTSEFSFKAMTWSEEGADLDAIAELVNNKMQKSGLDGFTLTFKGNMPFAKEGIAVGFIDKFKKYENDKRFLEVASLSSDDGVITSGNDAKIADILGIPSKCKLILADFEGSDGSFYGSLFEDILGLIRKCVEENLGNKVAFDHSGEIDFDTLTRNSLLINCRYFGVFEKIIFKKMGIDLKLSKECVDHPIYGDIERRTTDLYYSPHYFLETMFWLSESEKMEKILRDYILKKKKGI